MPANRENRMLAKLDCWIRSRGMSQKAFALKCGISQPHFNEIINGKKIASAEVAKKISLGTNGEILVKDLQPVPWAVV